MSWMSGTENYYFFCDIKSDVKIEIDSRTITKFIMWNS